MSLRNSLERSKTPPITAKRGGKMMAVRIQLLDDSINLFQVQQKANGRVLFEQVCRQLSLLEADYFGLEYEDATGIKYWLDLDKPMNCQLGLSMMDPLLRFCVKFYTPDPAQLEEEYTRYLFCLQIKRDLATGLLQCNDNTAALMASYIVQGDCGDYVEEDYPTHAYLSSYKFFPHQNSELERKIMENHKKHVGQSPAEADLNLLETARRCDLYGIKMHPSKDIELVPLNLAVAHMGIIVFQNYTKINTFSWAKIRKLSFKRKRFLIKLHPEGYGYYKDTVEFYFDGRNECKSFWKKCVEHHGFFRCSTIKRSPRHKTKILSRGSSFRYSGKTQKQMIEFVRENFVRRQSFQRSHSFRHSNSIHSSVANVGTSVSAQPLLPLSDNMLNSAISQSCGSMTLSSKADPQSPSHTVDFQDFDHKEIDVSFPNSRPGTMSQDTSSNSSPQRYIDRYHDDLSSPIKGNYSSSGQLSYHVSTSGNAGHNYSHSMIYNYPYGDWGENSVYFSTKKSLLDDLEDALLAPKEHPKTEFNGPYIDSKNCSVVTDKFKPGRARSQSHGEMSEKMISERSLSEPDITHDTSLSLQCHDSDCSLSQDDNVFSTDNVSHDSYDLLEREQDNSLTDLDFISIPQTEKGFQPFISLRQSSSQLSDELANFDFGSFRDESEKFHSNTFPRSKPVIPVNVSKYQELPGKNVDAFRSELDIPYKLHRRQLLKHEFSSSDNQDAPDLPEESLEASCALKTVTIVQSVAPTGMKVKKEVIGSPESIGSLSSPDNHSSNLPTQIILKKDDKQILKAQNSKPPTPPKPSRLNKDKDKSFSNPTLFARYKFIIEGSELRKNNPLIRSKPLDVVSVQNLPAPTSYSYIDDTISSPSQLNNDVSNKVKCIVLKSAKQAIECEDLLGHDSKVVTNNCNTKECKQTSEISSHSTSFPVMTNVPEAQAQNGGLAQPEIIIETDDDETINELPIPVTDTYPTNGEFVLNYAFPSRALSRISERDTASEQEESHFSSPSITDEIQGSIPSEDRPPELPTDESISDDTVSDAPGSVHLDITSKSKSKVTCQMKKVVCHESDDFPPPPCSSYLGDTLTEPIQFKKSQEIKEPSVKQECVHSTVVNESGKGDHKVYREDDSSSDTGTVHESDGSLHESMDLLEEITTEEEFEGERVCISVNPKPGQVNKQLFDKQSWTVCTGIQEIRPKHKVSLEVEVLDGKIRPSSSYQK